MLISPDALNTFCTFLGSKSPIAEGKSSLLVIGWLSVVGCQLSERCGEFTVIFNFSKVQFLTPLLFIKKRKAIIPRNNCLSCS